MDDKKKKIYIFGNPLLDFDNLPIKMQPELTKVLPQYEFIIADPNENLKPINKELVIIDTVHGIEDVRVFNDVDKIEDTPKYSMHDFDLGFNLKLLKKIGELEKVTIFCVPPNMKKDKALKNLVKLIKTTFL